MAGNLTAMIASIFSGSAVTADPYFEYTTLLLPGNGTNGAQNNTFLDSGTANGGVGFTITRNGNTTQGTFSPFSQTGWGNYFDGDGDYLTATANAAYTLGTNNHTIECWFYLDGAQQTSSTIWAYASGSTNTSTNSYFLTIGNTSGALLLGNGSGGWGVNISLTTPSKNTWHHLAIVRNGNVFTVYIDGVVTGTPATYSANIASQSTFPFEIGGQVTGTGTLGSTAFKGYISNFRVVNGTAVYTAAFTPPTSELTAITNTILLTCQSNRFKDNSTNNFAITIGGSPSVQAFSPFNPSASWSAATYGGSGYFDGSGDYLSTPNVAGLRLGAGDFCLEALVYPTRLTNTYEQAIAGTHGYVTGSDKGYEMYLNASGYPAFFIGNTSGATQISLISSTLVTANAWNHIAAVRSGSSTNNVKLYLNGVQVAQGTTTYDDTWTGADFNIGTTRTDNLTPTVGNSGTSLQGYISNLRLVKGSPVYTGNFTPPSLAPLTTAGSTSAASYPSTTNVNTSFASSATSLLLNFTNAGIYDATSKNDLETVGNAQISTTQSKWGSTSIKFDGTGDTLTIPSSVLTTLATGDFTLEAWFYLSVNATTSLIYGNGPWAANKWALHTNGSSQVNKLSFFVNNISSTAATMAGTTTLSTGVWYHAAVTRSGTTFRLFLNGTQEASTTSSASIDGGVATTTYVGSDSSLASTFFNGYMQDLRLTKGYARYTANFTPPTAAFPTL